MIKKPQIPRFAKVKFSFSLYDPSEPFASDALGARAQNGEQPPDAQVWNYKNVTVDTREGRQLGQGKVKSLCRAA